MESKKVIKGQWWLPEKEDIKVAGILFKADNGYYNLELFGNIENDNTIKEGKEYEIINGVSLSDKYYTLSRVITKNPIRSKKGGLYITYFVEKVLENLYAKTYDEIKFSNIYINFLYLDDWILIKVFNEEINNDGMKIEYKKPEGIRYNINKIFDLNINFTYPTYKVSIYKSIIKQDIEIEIIANNFNLDWYEDKIQILKYLFAFLMNKPTKQTYLKGKLFGSNEIVTIYNSYDKFNMKKAKIRIHH